MKTLIVWLFVFCLTLEVPVYAGNSMPGSTSPIIYIFDASGSMWEKIGDKSKFEIATEVLTNSVNGLADGQNIGFVVY